MPTSSACLLAASLLLVSCFCWSAGIRHQQDYFATLNECCIVPLVAFWTAYKVSETFVSTGFNGRQQNLIDIIELVAVCSCFSDIDDDYAATKPDGVCTICRDFPWVPESLRYLWHLQVNSQHFPAMFARNLGSMGYVGTTSLFIPSHVQERLLVDNGNLSETKTKNQHVFFCDVFSIVAHWHTASIMCHWWVPAISWFPQELAYNVEGLSLDFYRASWIEHESTPPTWILCSGCLTSWHKPQKVPQQGIPTR